MALARSFGVNSEKGRDLQSGFELLEGVLGGLAEKLGVGAAEFLEVGLAVLHTQRLGEVQVWLSDICHRSGLSGGKKRAPGTFPSTRGHTAMLISLKSLYDGCVMRALRIRKSDLVGVPAPQAVEVPAPSARLARRHRKDPRRYLPGVFP